MKRFLRPGPRWALGLVLLAAGGAWAGLWWNSSRRPEIGFLPNRTPARWIVYPSAAAAAFQRPLEFETVFRSSFVLARAPEHAVMRLAGYRRYAVAINDVAIDAPGRRADNWKQPDRFDVARQLRPGQNRITVTVYNSNGPPALWLALETDGPGLRTDETWEASFAGAAWRAARLATKQKFMPAGGPTHQGEPPLGTCLRTRWLALLIFAVLPASACWVRLRTNRRGRDALPRVQAAQQRGPATGAAFFRKPLRRELIPIALLAGLWVALFANNLSLLSPRLGFDVSGHTDYIRYVQEHHALPLAGEGWEMFQPPLYYVLAAGLLELLSLAVSDPAGVMALRLLGLAIGVAHFVIVWAALRLLFPAQRSKAGWGVVLAAGLPPMLYLSQYITNEVLAAALVSACVWLTLRALQSERISWTQCAGLGLCLGAALLAKSTALLVVPVVCGALLWKWLERRSISVCQGAGRLGLVVGVCAVVSGWHYARLWLHYGSPFVGAWDPRVGFLWWQDDGYRTGAFYARFGEVLFHPWFGAWTSFGDGIYTTLWGDGLLGGVGDFFSRPPWNVELMAIGYWLALLPTLAVLAGVVVAVLRFIRQPTAEWFLVLGLGFLVALALVHMSLVIPYNCMVKAFYGLSALVPFCALGASGLDALAGGSTKLRCLLWLATGAWAINSYASFWILPSSTRPLIHQASSRLETRQYAAAAGMLKTRLQSDPQDADVRCLLARVLSAAGEDEESVEESRIVVRNHPDDFRGHQLLSLGLAGLGREEQAVAEARRTVELAPGFDSGWDNLATLLVNRGDYAEAVRVSREGLATAPASAELRMALGASLLCLGQPAEASAQFRCAYRLNPASTDQLKNLAWRLATDQDDRKRDGARAVELAEAACALAEYRDAACLSALAAAYAETGRFPEAIKTAELARTSAMTSGRSDLALKSLDMIKLFRTGEPCREKKAEH